MVRLEDVDDDPLDGKDRCTFLVGLMQKDIFFHGGKSETPYERSLALPETFSDIKRKKINLSPHTDSPAWHSAIDGLVWAVR